MVAVRIHAVASGAAVVRACSALANLTFGRNDIGSAHIMLLGLLLETTLVDGCHFVLQHEVRSRLTVCIQFPMDVRLARRNCRVGMVDLVAIERLTNASAVYVIA